MAGPVEPPQDEDGDSLWLMVFLNLLLVLLAVFIMILSFQHFGPQDEAHKPKTEASDSMAARERRRALELKRKLSALVSNGQLKGTVVDMHRGRPRIVMASGVVFATGRADLTRQAKKKLTQVARELRPLHNQLMIEGHTDDRPIQTARFPSNWELSVARALAVVKYFVQNKISADRLEFVGHGQHQPRSSNDTGQGRRLNRRIEIKVK